MKLTLQGTGIDVSVGLTSGMANATMARYRLYRDARQIHCIRVGLGEDIDAELIRWLRSAYDAA